MILKKPTTLQLIIFIASGLFLLGFLLLEAMKKGDFIIFLDAATRVNNHKEIYDNIWLGNGLGKYYYSPLFALLLIPFTYLPMHLVIFLWLCADLYFLSRIWTLICSKLDISIFTKKQYVVFILLILALVLKFLLLNFDDPQMTIFLLWAMLESLNFFEKNENIRGAILLALAINIKMMPVAIVPYLLLRKKLYPVMWVATFYTVMLFLPALILGFHSNNVLLNDWFCAIDPSIDEHNFDTTYSTQGIATWLAPLLMKTGGELPLRRNIANLDTVTVNWIIGSVRGLFIIATFYFTGITFFKEAKSKLRMLWETSYIFLAIPMVFPHQQKYEYFLTLPAAAYISYFLVYQFHNKVNSMNNGRWKTILILFGVSFVLNTLTSDLFLGTYLSRVTQHYKAVTYGTILLAIVLALCKPKYIEQTNADEFAVDLDKQVL